MFRLPLKLIILGLFSLWFVTAPVGFVAAQEQTEVPDTPQESQAEKQDTTPLGASFNRQVLSIDDYGYSQRVRLLGRIPEQAVTLPSYPGYKPDLLTFRLKHSPLLQSGFFNIEAKGKVLETFVFPSEEDLIEVDLSNVEVDDDRITIVFQGVSNPEFNVCYDPQALWIDLEDMRFEFIGEVVPPKFVADFWPPDTAELRLFVPQEPNLSEVQAVLSTIVAVQHDTVGHDVRVTVQKVASQDELPTPPNNPLSRSIFFQSAKESDVSLFVPEKDAWPILIVRAPEKQMMEVVEILGLPSRDLFLASSVGVTPVARPKLEASSTLSFEDLGFPVLEMTGIGRLERDISFSQSDFGGPVGQLQLALRGTHTPIPNGGTAHIEVVFNGVLVDSVLLDDELQFDNDFSFSLDTALEESLLQRDNNLLLRTKYTPSNGECRVDKHELTVSIDPTSTLTRSVNESPLHGFDRYPQALIPSFQVAFDEMSETTLTAGAQLVTLLQRLSTVKLEPTALQWSQVTGTKETLVAVARDAKQMKNLSPLFDPTVLKVSNTQADVIFKADVKLGVMQAVERGNRDVLLLTHQGDEQALTDVPNKLYADEGWYGLSGNVAVTTGSDPLRIIDLPLLLEPEVIIEDPLRFSRAFIYVISMFLGLLAAFFVLYFFAKKRKKGE